ncbi:hypothetical protein Tco_1204438 [Tanacetum coccineum]
MWSILVKGWSNQYGIMLKGTGLVNPVRPNEKRAVQTINTARPVSTASLLVLELDHLPQKPVQTLSVVRPIYPRMDNDNPEICLQDHAVVDSSCSSHMTGNKAYLSDYKDYNRGFMAFRSDPKGKAMRFQALQEEEAARQVHLDALPAKRISEEEELSEQQKKRKAEVQEAAQYYTKEDWDTIRAKLEANAELTKSLQGESMTSKDFAKRMVEMINQKKKFYAEQKAKARRSKPMTQAHQRDYMSTFIKNQSSWKLTQLKKLTFDELKTEFEKLVKSIENFVPMETDERVKRQGVQLEQEFSKKQKTIEEVSVLEESITEPVIAKE